MTSEPLPARWWHVLVPADQSDTLKYRAAERGAENGIVRTGRSGHHTFGARCSRPVWVDLIGYVRPVGGDIPTEAEREQNRSIPVTELDCGCSYRLLSEAPLVFTVKGGQRMGACAVGKTLSPRHLAQHLGLRPFDPEEETTDDGV